MNTFERLDLKRLEKVVRRVRNRWRMRVALRGSAVVVIAGTLALLALTLGLDYFRYRPWALFLFSAITYVGLLSLIFRFLVIPLSRRVTDKCVALYIGEHMPKLSAEMISAVELSNFDKVTDSESTSRAFAREVVQSAVYNLHEIEYGRVVERGKLRRFSTVLAATMAFVMMMMIMSPAFLRTGTPLLFMPWARSAFANPYAIDVLPGDVQIARGADQLVSAQLVGFDSERVEIAVKPSGGDWEYWPMTIDESTSEFTFLVFDVGSEAEYFVESAGVRSSIYSIDVVDLPYVDTMDLEFHFPEYSGLQPRTIEDTGDIAVLAGTRVIVFVAPTVRVPYGRLVLDLDPEVDDSTSSQPFIVDLELSPDGKLKGAFNVERDGSYRVELPGFGGSIAAASPDYFIEALEDQPPRIVFEEPGRDTTVSPLDEAYVEIHAEDDFGVTSLDLIYSVNGNEEVSTTLYHPSEGGVHRLNVSAGYTFYLEEEELEAGDFISYYARGTDNQNGDTVQTGTTDIYFMEVRPFDRVFRQQQQGGGGGAGGGGGGQQEDTAFARRQRQIVAATFRLIRDRKRFSQQDYESDLGTLAINQSRLREQVELVLGRTQQRGAMMPGSDFEKMAENMRKAVTEMIPAEAELGRFDAEAALPPEQRALQFLQRADALIREAQVSFGGGGGGGGGGGDNALNESLADLLDLEMEKLRNQYEAVQRDQQQQLDEEIDEALQRLEELSRRQQQENERQRALAGLPQNQQGGGGGSQRQLASEAEELARQLERLARANSEPAMQELSRSLQKAADAMRRAASSNDDRALAEGLRALNDLRQTKGDLQNERSQRLQRDIDDMQTRIDRLQEEQQKIAEDVQQVGADAARGGNRQRLIEQMERVLERKDELTTEVADLEQQIETTARASRRDEREAARKLQETSNWMRDSKLADKIRYSKGVAQQRLGPYAEQFEQQITNDLDYLSEMVDEAAELVEGSQQDDLTSALDDTRGLISGLESFSDRAQQGLERQRETQQGEQQGQEGQQGQQGGVRNNAGRLGGGQTWGGTWDEQARQLEAEWDRRIDQAEALRERLANEDQQVTDLDEILNEMRDWEFDGTPRGIDELRHRVIDDLKVFEYTLRRLVDAELRPRPALADSDEVPSGYRKQVEEYFRALSRGSGNPDRQR